MKHRHDHYGRFAGLLGVLAIAIVIAACSGDGPEGIAETATADPYAQPDDTWISISGTVRSVSADAFVLDYGSGVITVEMDDGDRDADGYKLVEGDNVTVSGVIDDDFYETTTIEAGSVYVEKLGTYFYASAADEEDVFVTYFDPVAPSRVVVQGTVTDVDAEAFTLHTGTRALRVQVDRMPYNPLDDEGYQKIEAGDRVSVSGTMDVDFFEGRELTADSILTIAS